MIRRNKFLNKCSTLVLFIGIFLFLIPAHINAQTIMDASVTYVHSQKPSFKAKFIQSLSSVFGVKKIIEKSITKNKIKQYAAPAPKSFVKKYEVIQDTVMNRNVWTITSKESSSDKIVMYLHGGAYYWNISKYNWSFTEQLVDKTKATFIIPDYPLAPKANCEEVYEFISELYAKIQVQHPNKKIIIMGESAGGGLALGFAMWLREHEKTQPEQLILLAPWLDVTMANPNLSEIDKNDKILGIKGLQLAGNGYAGNLSTKDYRVSPIYGNLNDLAKISIFVGTHDLFCADSRLLKDKMRKNNTVFNYFEYPKMFHVWVLVKKLKEAIVAIEQIVNLITTE